MTAGRKKIPDELKALKGTDQPCRLHGEGVGFGIVLNVEPPEYLSDEATQIFIEKSEMLINQRILTEADIPLLIIYCNALADYYDCIKHLNEKGKIYLSKAGIPEINPYMKMRKQLFEEINKIGAQFGMSPTTRIISKAMEQKDEFMKFLED